MERKKVLHACFGVFIGRKGKEKGRSGRMKSPNFFPKVGIGMDPLGL